MAQSAVMPTLALVVPGLHQGGGVPAVARFVHDVAVGSGRWQVRAVSLCMSSRAPESTSLLRPRELLREPAVGLCSWLDKEVPLVGARFGELEFQRYRPRRALARLLVDCNVIQVVAGSPAWANAVIGLGKPVSLQVATRARVERRQRAADELDAAGFWRRAMTRVTDRLDDRALRRVDAIQVENPWMLDYVRKANAERLAADVRYAPPGVDAGTFCPLPVRDLSTDPYILCVGRLDDPRKRVGLLLEAYAQLAPALRERVRLVLAGSGRPSDAFWSRAESLGVRARVSFVPKPDQAALVSLYQRASVFALPSDEEGFGMVVIEAMACGVPVVATRCGGPGGILTEGVDGFLVPRDNVAAISDRVAKLLRDGALNIAMGQKSRATVGQRYEQRVAGAAFRNVWDALLRKAGC